MQDIKSKTAIITGASSGIGRQAARRLAAEGMRLALVGRSRARLEPLMAELGGGHAIVTADLTVPSEADRMVQAAEAALGRVDVLFANAGLYLPGNITETEPGAIEELINVNVTAVFRAVRAALPGMIAHGGGDIVVTSSVSGHQAIYWSRSIPLPNMPCRLSCMACAGRCPAVACGWDRWRRGSSLPNCGARWTRPR